MAERSGQPSENGPRHGARFVICVANASLPPATFVRLRQKRSASVDQAVLLPQYLDDLLLRIGTAYQQADR